MTILEKISLIREKIAERAQIKFGDTKNECQEMGEFIQEFLGNMHNSVLGGKAVRGALIYYTAKYLGSKDDEALLDLGLAMEMYHSYLLIHDDIIDQDDLRRGKPSFHALYRHWHDQSYEKNEPRHFGHSMAIMAGDMLSSLAYNTICEIKLDPKTRLSVLKTVNKMLFETGAGEVLDIINDMQEHASRANVLKVSTLKTALYTFVSPLRLGATAAQASPEQLQMLENYALPIGIAFQLHDDLLGMFANEKKLGKPLYSDLKQGKQTLLIIEAYERATAAQQKAIDQALGNPNLTPKQAQNVLDIIKETGSYDYSVQMAQKLHDESLGYLDKNLISEEGYQFYKDIADYIIKRDY